MTKYSKVPVFENGMAQPVFPFLYYFCKRFIVE